MKLFDIFTKMSMFCQLVEQERTGTPDEFAERLNISRTTLYDIIAEIRSRDIEIKYSRTRQTFYYESPVNIEIRLSMRKLTTPEMQNVSGGQSVFHSVLFLGRNASIFVVNK